MFFSKYKKIYFHIYALRNTNKKVSKSNKLIYNCVLNKTKKKLKRSKFFELILKHNKGFEGRVNYSNNKGINYMNLYREGKLK